MVVSPGLCHMPDLFWSLSFPSCFSFSGFLFLMLFSSVAVAMHLLWSLLLLGNIPLTEYVVIFYYPVERHSGEFHLGAPTRSSAMNFLAHVSWYTFARAIWRFTPWSRIAVPWALLPGLFIEKPSQNDCPRHLLTEGLLSAQDHTANECKAQGFVLNVSFCNLSSSSIPQIILTTSRPAPNSHSHGQL